MENYNQLAEMSILGCILKDSDTILRVKQDLKIEDFYMYKSFYEQLLRMLDKEIAIDMVTVSSHTSYGMEEITNIAQVVDTTANIDEYIKIVKDKSTLRQLISAVNDVTKKIKKYEAAKNINELLVECKAAMDIEYQGGKKYKDMSGLIIKFLENVEYRQMKAKEGLVDKHMYGFDWLDNFTNGSRPGEVAVLAGLSGMGKTALAGQIALNKASKGAKVGIFSLEMDENEIFERLVINMTDINSTKCRAGKLEEKDFILINNNLDKLSKMPITIIDYCFDIEELSINARDLHLKDRLNYLIIDYMQLLDTKARYTTNTESLDFISRQIKLLAKTLKIPILCLCQFNNSPLKERRRPYLSDLRGSGKIAQDADLVMFLYPEYKNIDEKKAKGEPLDIYLEIGKQRNGQCGRELFEFDGSRYNFYEKRK